MDAKRFDQSAFALIADDAPVFFTRMDPYEDGGGWRLFERCCRFRA